MAFADRADIQKRQNRRILEHFVTGNLTGNDFTKDATGLFRGHCRKPFHSALPSFYRTAKRRPVKG
jgi:hypothetical protein